MLSVVVTMYVIDKYCNLAKTRQTKGLVWDSVKGVFG